MRPTIDHYDVFTKVAFSGNPAAVCILPDEHAALFDNEQWCQGVAADMNLPETAFLRRNDNGYDIRYFTPTVEIAFCGHATIASLRCLLEREMARASDVVALRTRFGRELTGRQDADFRASVELEAAAPEPVGDSDPRLAILARACKVSPVAALADGNAIMLVLPNADDIRHLQRDLTVLNELPGGAYFTARSDVSGVDTISRCFFPSQGINEDPATGSAHLAIARYWSPLLAKRELVCFQASARGGTLQLRVDGSRVTLAGNAVPISRGELLVV